MSERAVRSDHAKSTTYVVDVDALGEALNTKRFRDRCTWGDIAKVTGCSRTQLHYITSGGSTPSLNVAVSLIRWLGRPVDEFVISREHKASAHVAVTT